MNHAPDADDSTFDYQRELDRRIGQFAGYLRKMHHRAHEEVCGNCFIIFEEQRPDAGDDQDKLTEAAAPELALVEAAFEDAGISCGFVSDELFNVQLPTEGWKEDGPQRFIQFSFERNWFCMDMPLNTLYRPEAEQILRSRNGFFFLRDRPEFTLYEEDAERWDPFRKIYVYGDEDSAAEDVAFIFFKVWRFPLDSRFYVKSAAFGNKKSNWEWGTPIE